MIGRGEWGWGERETKYVLLKRGHDNRGAEKKGAEGQEGGGPAAMYL